MYKTISLLLIVLSKIVFAQQLPRFDNGIMLSYNNSGRHIPSATFASEQRSGNYPSLDYKLNFNFKNRCSLKTGASLFVVGHKFSYLASPDRGPGLSKEETQRTVYVYTRVPLLFSINVKRFFIDIGAAACLRVFNNSDSYAYQRGNGIEKPGITYTLESHLGYYIPVKQRRLFVEGGVYISEIGNMIFLPKGSYKNKYSQTLQLSVGFMFNKL